MMDVLNSWLPRDWSYMGESGRDYELVEISAGTSLYGILNQKVRGDFNMGTKKIVRVQNPFLYGQFQLKKEEYEVVLGRVSVQELFHDTGSHKIDSIVSGNLDWRRACRVKFGRGVSFSPSPAYANKESSRNNGAARAMIIADVLVGLTEIVSTSRQLPHSGCDTTVSNSGQVYVKYYDNEFYPKYIVYYTSKQRMYRSFYNYPDWMDM